MYGIPEKSLNVVLCCLVSDAEISSLRFRFIILQHVRFRTNVAFQRNRYVDPIEWRQHSHTRGNANSYPQVSSTSCIQNKFKLLQSIVCVFLFSQETGGSPYNAPTSQGSISDLTLYQSPSMPNISLGRPPVPASTANVSLMHFPLFAPC